MNWIDSTTYSRDAKERKQTGWTLNLGLTRITITCGHIYFRGQFVMHCSQLGFDTFDLKIPADRVEDAKFKAIKLCLLKAKKMATELEAALPIDNSDKTETP